MGHCKPANINFDFDATLPCGRVKASNAGLKKTHKRSFRAVLTVIYESCMHRKPLGVYFTTNGYIKSIE